MEIFELRGPVAGECGFDARTGAPADIGVVDAGKAGLAGFDVADSKAASDIRHHAVPRVADAAAHGSKPVVLGLAAGRASDIHEAAFDVGPVEVALQAEHPGAAGSLPVVARCSTNHAARWIGVAGEGAPVRAAPGVTAVDAEIEPGPVVSDRYVGRGPRGHGPRQIGRHSGSGGDSKKTNSREEYATHTHLPLLCSQLADKRGQSVDGSWNFEGRPQNLYGGGECCLHATYTKGPGRDRGFLYDYGA